MGTFRYLLPLALVVIAPPLRPGDAPTPSHRAQALRTGDGQPRTPLVQGERPVRTADPKPTPPGPTRPYRPSQPDEGAPKAARS